jgi:hypothetical protein
MMIQIAPKNSTATFAHHFKSCGYYTYQKEYGVNFMISLYVLCEVYGRKWGTDKKAAPVYILQKMWKREKVRRQNIIYMLLLLCYMQQQMFHTILLQDADLCVFTRQSVKLVAMYSHMTGINPL